MNSKNLDHLGIVSQICDEIGIVEAIDKLIPPDPNLKISHRECVKLMVINDLSFTSRPSIFGSAILFLTTGKSIFDEKLRGCDQ